MNGNRPRLMLAAPRSGSGKTTVTCALLGALQARGVRVASFKCGPDYIDPMFHRSALGVPSFNLDPFLLDRPELLRTLTAHGGEELSLLEGAMGYYDGIAMTTEASGYELAGSLGVPVVLVIDCKGAAASISAQIRGFLCHREDSNIKGVLLNRLPERLYPQMTALIERELPLQVCGWLPEMPDCAFESRHLGLIPAQELKDLGARLERLSQQAARSFELDTLLAIAKSAPALETPAPASGAPSGGAPVRIALARDEAFCFYYEEALQRLQELGGQLVPFSPLHDRSLPKNIDGLLLGGGYPELYARRLSENRPLLDEMRALVTGGLPTIAECGGFMLLQEALEGTDGRCYPMAGALPGECRRQQRLCRFGYARYTALSDGLLCKKGESLPVHSFHYWDSTAPGESFSAQKPGRETSWREGVMTDSLYAGFGHLHLGHGELAGRFIARCRGAQKERKR